MMGASPLVRALLPLVPSLVLVLAACDRLVPDEEDAPPPPLERGAFLHHDPAGIARLLTLALAEQEQLGSFSVTQAEGFLDLPEGGTLTYGPEQWQVPLALASLTSGGGVIELELHVLPVSMSWTLIYRPRHGVLRRCDLELKGPRHPLQLVLAPDADAAGRPVLGVRSSTIAVAPPLPTVSEDCPRLIRLEQQTVLAEVAAQTQRLALQGHLVTLVAGLSEALGMGISLRGMALAGPPMGGSLRLDLQVGDPRAFGTLHGVIFDAEGLTMPLRVGLQIHSGGCCGPPVLAEPAAPTSLPTFQGAGIQPAPGATTTLALSAQLLSRVVGSALEAGFPCQPLSGEQVSGLKVADLPALTGLKDVAPPGAPLRALVRPGESIVELMVDQPWLQVAMRRVALDLYVQLDGADLRCLGATADVVLDLSLAAGPEPGSLILQLRPGGVAVTPRWVSSELLATSTDLVPSLAAVYAHVLELVASQALQLPVVRLGSRPIRLLGVRQGGSYLYLSFEPA